MKPSSPKARDAGLALIARVNSWLITGALGVSALLSIVAAHAFHARTVNSSTRLPAAGAPHRTAPSSSDDSGSSSSSGLSQPSQAPAAAAPAPSPAVSGGS